MSWSATVEQAAETIGVRPARIAKKLSGKHLALKQECSLLMRYLSRQAMKLEGVARLDWLMTWRFILMYR